MTEISIDDPKGYLNAISQNAIEIIPNKFWKKIMCCLRDNFAINGKMNAVLLIIHEKLVGGYIKSRAVHNLENDPCVGKYEIFTYDDYMFNIDIPTLILKNSKNMKVEIKNLLTYSTYPEIQEIIEKRPVYSAYFDWSN